MDIWKQRLKEARIAKGLNKTEFAKAVGVSNPTVTDWEKSADIGGIKEITGVNLMRACNVLNITPQWLLSTEANSITPTSLIERGADRRQANAILSRITAIHPDDAPQDDVVFVPESKIAFSAGNGCVARYELVEDQEPASYRLSWFQKYGINPDRARRFRVSGDSMEPMLFDRDTILVNTDETAVVDGKMYAIRYGDELRVKYLIRRLDGTLILRSVNPLYKEEEVAPKLAEEHITVLGRVRDRSGTGGL